MWVTSPSPPPVNTTQYLFLTLEINNPCSAVTALTVIGGFYYVCPLIIPVWLQTLRCPSVLWQTHNAGRHPAHILSHYQRICHTPSGALGGEEGVISSHVWALTVSLIRTQGAPTEVSQSAVSVLSSGGALSLIVQSRVIIIRDTERSGGREGALQSIDGLWPPSFPLPGGSLLSFPELPNSDKNTKNVENPCANPPTYLWNWRLPFLAKLSVCCGQNFANKIRNLPHKDSQTWIPSKLFRSHCCSEVILWSSNHWLYKPNTLESHYDSSLPFCCIRNRGQNPHVMK